MAAKDPWAQSGTASSLWFSCTPQHLPSLRSSWGLVSDTLWDSDKAILPEQLHRKHFKDLPARPQRLVRSVTGFEHFRLEGSVHDQLDWLGLMDPQNSDADSRHPSSLWSTCLLNTAFLHLFATCGMATTNSRKAPFGSRADSPPSGGGLLLSFLRLTWDVCSSQLY